MLLLYPSPNQNVSESYSSSVAPSGLQENHDVCTRLLAANGVPPAAEVGPGGVPTGQWSKPAKKMRKNDGSTRKIYGNHRKIMISIACIADLI